MDQGFRALRVVVFVYLAVALAGPAFAADIVAWQAGSSGLIIKPLISFEFGVLTVNAPDGVTFNQEFRAGSTIVFHPGSRAGYQPPDGTYLWEVKLASPSAVNPKLREMAKAARESGDAEIEVLHRVALTKATQSQSGAFVLARGTMVPSDLTEPNTRPSSSGSRDVRDPFKQAEWLHDNPSIQPVDQVIPDDLIVQGSLCVGFDCVNNESFGFDTIRLKENNTRIKFQDTSVGTFPSNDWQLTANDSASGGSNKFSIEDITGSRVPFTVTAGAATNSIFVDSTGRVGFRTSTPVLDLHVATSNTPAMRLEQNNSGGFTAQTWDVAGNEANFFVRDVTGGSRLPFRIRPGAPTSSIDISADGDVGIGTASPDAKLHAVGRIRAEGVTGDTSAVLELVPSGVAAGFLFKNTTGNIVAERTAGSADLTLSAASVRLSVLTNCASGVRTDGTGVLSCIPSSARFKNVTGDLDPRVALANVMALRPQVGSYKETPEVPEHWLIAEQAAGIDPAFVGMADGKPFTIKTQNVVADLIAVVQQQQRRIEDQQRFIEQQQHRLEALERAGVR